jgi:hypothetical protein
MLVSHILDLVPIGLLFIGTLLVMVLFIEYGFRLGMNAKAKAKKAQTSQVRAIMGAALGLLAFMLAVNDQLLVDLYEYMKTDI